MSSLRNELCEFIKSSVYPSLSTFLRENKSVVKDHIMSFETQDDATANLQSMWTTAFRTLHPQRKRIPGLKVDISQLFTEVKAQKTIRIAGFETAAISTTIAAKEIQKDLKHSISQLDVENAITGIDDESGSNVDLGSQLSRESSSNVDFGSQSSREEFPSDITLNHHPRRQADYYFDEETVTSANDDDDDDKEEDEVEDEDQAEGEEEDENEEEEEENENEEEEEENENENEDKKTEWMIDDVTDVLPLFKQVKENTLRLNRDPGSLSDVRLLALNDIYYISPNVNSSVTRYVTREVHSKIISKCSFQQHRPDPCKDATLWCSSIAINPPGSWLEAASLSSQYLADAVASGNLLDIQAAQAFVSILPAFYSCQPNYKVEDSFVHDYLAPLLKSVFSSDSLFKLEWANAILSSDGRTFKPDFKVFGSFVNAECVVVVSEFKPAKSHSSIESDLVKLARQMRLTYNHLVLHGVPDPRVCGILCDGFKLSTLVMDMMAPQMYRLIQLGETPVFTGLQQLFPITTMLYHLNHIKSIALNTLVDAEKSVINTSQTLHRNSPVPPASWLSCDRYKLRRRKSSGQ